MNQSQINMSDMRARLRQTRESGPTPPASKPHSYDFRSTPRAPQYPFPGDTVSISTKLNETVERAKGPLLHLHLYWHFYIAGGIFVLFHMISLFPSWFPGMEGVKTPYQHGAHIIGFAFLTMPSVGVFFVLRSLRRSFQRAAKITEARSWSSIQWFGAVGGFAFMVYLTFFYSGGVSAMLEEHMLPEYQTGPFELTAREWIFAGVKCVGGAVGGSMLTNKFFGSGS